MNKRILPLAVAAWLIAGAAAGGSPAELVAAEVDAARSICEPLGVFAAPAAFEPAHADLNDDGVADLVFDYSAFECLGARSIYGGTGGIPVIALISGPEGFQRFKFVARGGTSRRSSWAPAVSRF